MTSIITEAGKAAHTGTEQSLQEILDFLVTQEQLSTTFLTAAIERAEGTPSAAFLPVLRNAVTTEFHHVEALRKVGGQPFAAKFWLPDAAFGNGGAGLFATAEIVESVEISLYLIGVSAYTHAHVEAGARLCAEALGTEAVHRALVRFAQGQLGKDVGVPNDVGFENFDWRTVASAREALEGLGIGYGRQGGGVGRFYEYQGDPVARGVGTPVTRVDPR
jgi:ferritin-like protein